MDWNEIVLWLFGGGIASTIIFSIIVSIICVVIPFTGIGWFVYSRWKKSDQMRTASQGWVSTKGTVIKSRVEVSGGEMTTTSPRVIYTYMVGALEYEGDQIQAGEEFWSARTGRKAYDTIDRYPEGATITVYYNPANPSESALER